MTLPRATVMGLGLFDGGAGVTRHLVRSGYAVTVTDLKTEAELAPTLAKLAGLDLRLRLGAHDTADFVETDLLVVNPAVKPGNAYVAAALSAGVPVTTEIALFVEACAGRVVAVTGTAGKSTTTALLARCLEASGLRTHLGGNIGRSLLDVAHTIGADDLVVLELSSFHLHWLRARGWRPWVGVYTNLAPNHLDWHGTLAAYAEDKSGIVPGEDGVLVASFDDGHVSELAARAPCRVVWTARDRVPPEGDAVFWDGDALVRRTALGARDALLERDDVRLLGAHALWNVAQAVAASLAAGGSVAGACAAVRDFAGLPHRLCPIGEVDGVLCVDDSKSTTPGATALALAAFDRPVLLLAGGYDKQLDPAPLVAAARERARVVCCYGATGPALAALLRAAGGPEVVLGVTLADAVAAARERARPGDVLLLSPGHASWDQFSNYEERARAFAAAAGCGRAGG